ncbi:cyclic pyranopterin monophosphate synthase [bacterium BMS3Abin08]|nr:cyclic pyranopterin monophosphate synthase [bacterium BMS3Abin08]
MKKNISVEIKVTDRCNLDCFHCVNNDCPDHGKDLDAGLFVEKLARWVDNQGSSSYMITEVRMTGGEPLLNLHTVTEIARTCCSLGIQSGINTNATLLDAPTARLLKKSGLEIVKISFDSIDETTLRQIRGPRASLAKTITGIHTAVENGFHVILRYTLCSFNRDQLVACYRMAREIGVEKFQVKPLIRAGRAIGSSGFLSREELCRAFEELAVIVNGPIARPEILCWPSKDTTSLTVKACAGINKIYFSTSYKAYFCNYLPWTDEIGDLTRDTLEDLLQRRSIKVCEGRSSYPLLTGCRQIEYLSAGTNAF